MALNHHRVGGGEPLVLIHGIGSRWQMWNPVLERLSAEREVVAIDLPGFGASPPAPPGTPAGVSSLTRLVAEFLAGIGLALPHVAGSSLGGWISLELAKRAAVRSATALSPAGFWNQRESTFARLSLSASVRAARALTPVAGALAAPAAMRGLLLSQMVAHPGRLSRQEAAASLRALAAAPWYDETLQSMTAERFSGGEQIDVPVTVAWGERDRLLLPRQAARAAREIPGARSVTLHGCGHVPTWDDPEQVARVLLQGSAR